jgi:ketosteroid isomerase-like protein
MSQENVETLGRLYEAWGVGDFGVGRDVLDTNVTYIVRAPFPEPAVLVGADAISDYMRRFHEQFERGSHMVRADRFRVAGDTIVVDVTQQATGRTSGIAAEARFFTLFTFRGGKIIRFESILDEAEALEAAGLSE